MPSGSFDQIARAFTSQTTDGKQGLTREGTSQKLPKGVVLDKDGKPCRTCTSSAAWMAMMKSSTSSNSKKSVAAGAGAGAGAILASTTLSDCPPDVDELGRSTWTLLHTMAATYPSTAPTEMQSIMKQFLSTFSKLYPCWVCAEDFQSWMEEPGNEPKVKGQDDLGLWMCQAHNVVNVKLGKPEFDCNLWKQRWKDGWKDGRCD